MTLVYDEITKDAVEQALQVLGPGKTTVMSYLERHSVDLQDGRCSAEEIEGALQRVFGSGAQIVMQLMSKS